MTDLPITDRDMKVPDSPPSISRYEADDNQSAEIAPAQKKFRYVGKFRSDPELSLAPFGMVWPGIVLASACYPIVVAVVFGIYGVFAMGLPGLDLGMVLGLSIFGFFSGMIFGVIVSIPAFFLTQLLCRSSKGILTTRGAVAIFGGLTVFLCFFCGCLVFYRGIPVDLERQLLVLMVSFVLLAVVIGYSAVILVGYLCRYDDFPFFEPTICNEKPITIRTLLKLTAVVAVLAIIFKAAGVYVAITWLTYLVAQLFLLVCDHWITRWLGRRSHFY